MSDFSNVASKDCHTSKVYAAVVKNCKVVVKCKRRLIFVLEVDEVVLTPGRTVGMSSICNYEVTSSVHYKSKDVWHFENNVHELEQRRHS